MDNRTIAILFRIAALSRLVRDMRDDHPDLEPYLGRLDRAYRDLDHCAPNWQDKTDISAAGRSKASNARRDARRKVDPWSAPKDGEL